MFGGDVEHDLVSFKLLVREIVGFQIAAELSCGVALFFRIVVTHLLVASVCQTTCWDVLGDWFLCMFETALEVFHSVLTLISRLALVDQYR